MPQSKGLEWEQIQRLRKYTQFFHYQSPEISEVGFRLKSLVNKIVRLIRMDAKKYFIGSISRFALIGGDLPGDCDTQILVDRVDDWRFISNALIKSISQVLRMNPSNLVQSGLKKRNFLTDKKGETFGVMVTLPCRPLDLDIQIVTRGNSLSSGDFRICMDRLQAETVSPSFGSFDEALTLTENRELRFLNPQKIHEGFRVYCLVLLKGYKTVDDDEKKMCLGLCEQYPNPGSVFKERLFSFVSKKFGNNAEKMREYYWTYLRIILRSEVLTPEYKEKICVLVGPKVRVKSIGQLEKKLLEMEKNSSLLEFRQFQISKFETIDQWRAFYEKAKDFISLKQMVEILINSPNIKIIPLDILSEMKDLFHTLKVDDHLALFERLCMWDDAPFDLLTNLTLSLRDRCKGNKKRSKRFLKAVSSKPPLVELLKPKARNTVDRATSPMQIPEVKESDSALNKDEVLGPQLVREPFVKKSIAALSWEGWVLEGFNPFLHNFHIFAMMCNAMHRDSDWEEIFPKIEQKIAKMPDALLGFNSRNDYHNTLVITRFHLLLARGLSEGALDDKTFEELIYLLVKEFSQHHMSLRDVVELWKRGFEPYLTPSRKKKLSTVVVLCKNFTHLLVRRNGLKMAIAQERNRRVKMRMKLELKRMNKGFDPVQAALDENSEIVRLLERKR